LPPARPITLTLAILLTALRAGAAGAQAPAPVSGQALDAYIAAIARAWEPYTTADGRVEDPLDPADTGDNYGVIMLADVMLRTAARDHDPTLAQTGQRIVEKVTALPTVDGPFNLLAVAMLQRDGERGLFGAQPWDQIQGQLAQLAARIGPSPEPTCLSAITCYNNWRLVWSAGAGALLESELPAELEAAGTDPTTIGSEIEGDLLMALSRAGAPAIPSVLPGARELSDPGQEPLSYHLFSCMMLELISEADPAAITPPLAHLQAQAARYALELIAPDGQLSFAGRSLDQSWVQAAAAALGARRAAASEGDAARWRAFAERALSYLMSAYRRRPDGILPMVPGLDLEWSASLVDTYAALNQYDGLTLWLLEDALEHWPPGTAARAPIPSDARRLLVGDLGSSGLVWGRSGGVWWALSGRSTDADPRFAQGLVSVEVRAAGGWRDLLALRPRGGPLSSAWELERHRHVHATGVFTAVHGSGADVVLRGRYRTSAGRSLGRVTWRLATGAHGVTLRMTKSPKALLRTTIWTTSELVRVRARHATLHESPCTVTASGEACPVTISWRHGRSARLEVAAATPSVISAAPRAP
jgi:hypothetical protein